MSVVQGTFALERVYPYPPHKVFAAFSDPDARRKWSGAPGEDEADLMIDFRIGGRNSQTGTTPDGQRYEVNQTYRDIVPEHRIIYAYELTFDGRRHVVSIATVEFRPAPGGTRLTVTDQGVYLDGLETPKDLETGTRYSLDRLGDWLGDWLGEGD